MTKFPADATKEKQLLKEYENLFRFYSIKNRINIYVDYLASLSQQEEKIKVFKK